MMVSVDDHGWLPTLVLVPTVLKPVANAITWSREGLIAVRVQVNADGAIQAIEVGGWNQDWKVAVLVP